MNRRSFLGSSAAVAVATALPAPRAQASVEPLFEIDPHSYMTNDDHKRIADAIVAAAGVPLELSERALVFADHAMLKVHRLNLKGRRYARVGGRGVAHRWQRVNGHWS